MSERKAPMAVFLERPQGTDALPVAGSVARPSEAVRAVLHTADGGVLVQSVKREADGSFTGEVYGVTPQQRHVAVGDRISFSEPQIFRFKTADAGNTDPAEVETAEMIRAFAESFRHADAPSADRPVEVSPDDFSFDVDMPPAVHEPETQAPSPAETERPPAVSPAPPPKPEPKISVADAYATLRASEEDQRTSREARVEPVLDAPPAVTVAPTVEAQPVLPDAAPPVPSDPVPPVLADPAPPVLPDPAPPVLSAPASPAAAPAATAEPIACLECGTTLVVPAADPSGQVPPPSKVSCPSCGRINDIAQARAASLRRQRLTSAEPAAETPRPEAESG
jgi:hypothetical protein